MIPRPRVLCVDDDQFVLEALSRQLRRDYDVVGETDATKALSLLMSDAPFAVIMSDLRMPRMDGMELLQLARKTAPDTVRLLLTGNADIDAAIQLVNEAQIFRFLTKPCSREQLLSALAPAVEHHRLVTAERVLLEQTLHGSIEALMDALSLVNPMAFGRAGRLKRIAAELARRLEVKDRWEIEVAAMVSQIGMISLPATTIEKLFTGAALEREEADAIERVPGISDQLLAHVPRLEGVREIIRLQARRFDGGRTDVRDRRDGDALPIGARILKVVLDYDVLESAGKPPSVALEVMRSRGGAYDPAVLVAFAGMQGIERGDFEVRTFPLQDVLAGMRLMEDVKTRNGLLLIPKGFEMNAALRERMRSYDPAILAEPVQVVVPRKPADAPVPAEP